jgi:CubicO group peptidase (beta-lactamase class C family)
MKKRIFYLAGAVVLTALVCGTLYLNSLLPIITGYAAKYMCSAVFISKRAPSDVEKTDLNFSLVRYAINHVDYQGKSVISRFLWSRSKAVYRHGFGSMLLHDSDERAVMRKKFPDKSDITYDPDTMSWPFGNIIPVTNTGIDSAALSSLAAKLMFTDSYHGNAFAFMILYKGIPIAEHYKPGFSARTLFPGWSIAKGFMNAFTGMMVKDGLLDIHEYAAIDEWQNDERKNITIQDLMKMQSGLRWNEDYGNRSDVTRMLYESHDFARFAFDRRQDFPTGSNWNYSSGSVNIISYLLRKKFRDDVAYWNYLRERLFNKIGMPDAMIETDPTGTLAGSSYIYATARDYARFGLLYLRDGIFNNERILPCGWVKYTTTPVANSQGNYGTLFWLNKGGKYPSAPDDMFYCNGYVGQRIFIIPSRDLVVVVLGYSPKPGNEMNFNQLLNDILGTIH